MAKVELRAWTNRRVTHQLERRTRILHHPGSPLSFPSRRSMSHARHPTIHHRAHLATVFRLVTLQADKPPPRLSSPSHTRSGGLREARAGVGVRMRLLEDCR